MRIAVCPLRLTGATDCRWKPLSVCAKLCTSFALTAAAVSAAAAGWCSTRTELRFEVNVTFEPECVCAQPSGTVTEKPPAGILKRTNWVLSGMSPDGDFSFAFGLTAFDWVFVLLLLL